MRTLERRLRMRSVSLFSSFSSLSSLFRRGRVLQKKAETDARMSLSGHRLLPCSDQDRYRGRPSLQPPPDGAGSFSFPLPIPPFPPSPSFLSSQCSPSLPSQYSRTNAKATLPFLSSSLAPGTKAHQRFLWYALSKDRAEMSVMAKKVAAWDFERIIPAHGDVIETGGKKGAFSCSFLPPLPFLFPVLYAPRALSSP